MQSYRIITGNRKTPGATRNAPGFYWSVQEYNKALQGFPRRFLGLVAIYTTLASQGQGETRKISKFCHLCQSYALYPPNHKIRGVCCFRILKFLKIRDRGGFYI